MCGRRTAAVSKITETFDSYADASVFLVGVSTFAGFSLEHRSTDDEGRVNGVAMCTERFTCSSHFRGEADRARLAGARSAPGSSEAFGALEIDTGIADSATAAQDREHAVGLGFNGLKVHHGTLDCCAFGTILGPRVLLPTRSSSADVPAVAMDADRSETLTQSCTPSPSPPPTPTTPRATSAICAASHISLPVSLWLPCWIAQMLKRPR